MHFHVVCDFREQFSSVAKEMHYNDHASRAATDDFIECVKGLGYDCDYFGGIPELVKALDTGATFEDAMFVNLSDGLDRNYSRVQAPLLLDLLEVPFTGSEVFSCALLNNKNCTCAVARDKGFATPDSIRTSIMDRPSDADIERLLPVFVKPNAEGSSIGIDGDSLQETVDGARRQMNALLGEFGEVEMERYIPGEDVTVMVIGNPPEFKHVEAVHLSTEGHKYQSMEAKSRHIMQRRLCADVLGTTIDRAVCGVSERLFGLFDCRDIARFDFRIPENGTPVFIEANSFPRFSRTSEVGFLAEANGLPYEQYVNDFLESALGRIG